MAHILPDPKTMNTEQCVQEIVMHLRMWNAGNLRKMSLPKKEKETADDSKKIVEDYIEEHIKSGDAEDFVSCSEVVKHFKRWNKEKGHKEIKMKFVYAALNARNGHKNVGKVVNGQKKKGWSGIKLVPLSDDIMTTVAASLAAVNKKIMS